MSRPRGADSGFTVEDRAIWLYRHFNTVYLESGTDWHERYDTVRNYWRSRAVHELASESEAEMIDRKAEIWTPGKVARSWGDMPGIYFVKLECADRRWWHGEIVASNRAQAIATARKASGMPDAPLVACDQADGQVVPEVRHSAIVTPRGWEAPQGDA